MDCDALSWGGALRALILGGGVPPVPLPSGLRSPRVMFVAPSGLGKGLVRNVMLWLGITLYLWAAFYGAGKRNQTVSIKVFSTLENKTMPTPSSSRVMAQLMPQSDRLKVPLEKNISRNPSMMATIGFRR